MDSLHDMAMDSLCDQYFPIIKEELDLILPEPWHLIARHLIEEHGLKEELADVLVRMYQENHPEDPQNEGPVVPLVSSCCGEPLVFEKIDGVQPERAHSANGEIKAAKFPGNDELTSAIKFDMMDRLTDGAHHHNKADVDLDMIMTDKRDWLSEAYEECLDLAFYLKAELVRRYTFIQLMDDEEE